MRTITLICFHTVCPQIASHNPSCEEASHTHKKKKKTEAIIVATPYEFVQDDQTLTVTVEPQNTQTCKEKKKKEDQAKEAEENSTNNNNNSKITERCLFIFLFFLLPSKKTNEDSCNESAKNNKQKKKRRQIPPHTVIHTKKTHKRHSQTAVASL